MPLNKHPAVVMADGDVLEVPSAEQIAFIGELVAAFVPAAEVERIATAFRQC